MAVVVCAEWGAKNILIAMERAHESILVGSDGAMKQFCRLR